MDLYNFLFLACDESYEINIFYNNTGVELLHQVEVGNVEEELEKIGCGDFMEHEVESWDIGYFNDDEKEEFTINIG